MSDLQAKARLLIEKYNRLAKQEDFDARLGLVVGNNDHAHIECDDDNWFPSQFC